MQLALIKIIEKIKTHRVPEDIFYLQLEIKRIVDCQKKLKESLRQLGIELRKFKIDTLSKQDELLFTRLTGDLIVLVKKIYMCGATYYGSHNELYGGSISGFKRGVNNGLHCWLQYPLEFLKEAALSIADKSRENRFLSKVGELEILLKGYDQLLIEQARFKPFSSFQAKSIFSREPSSRSFFTTNETSKQLSHTHDTLGKKGLNPNAPEFVPQFLYRA